MKATAAIAGHEPVLTINKRSIKDGTERRREKPQAANNRLRTTRGLFAWAVENAHATRVSTHAVKVLGGRNDRNGFHTWTEAVARFEARWPLDRREHVALDVLLYTGLRRGDALRIGRPHLRNGVLRLAAEKASPDVSIRVLQGLAATLAAGPSANSHSSLASAAAYDEGGPAFLLRPRPAQGWRTRRRAPQRPS